MINIHLKRYETFIQSRKSRVLPINSLYEVHHIIPRAIGGLDIPSNLIKLTLREHFIAHLILWKLYGGSMTYAFYFLSKSKSKGSLSSRQSEALRSDLLSFQKNKICITNGLQNRCILATDIIPQGFYRGSTQKKSEIKLNALRNLKKTTRRITDGLLNKTVGIDDTIPNGWRIGFVLTKKRLSRGLPKTVEERTKISNSHTGKVPINDGVTCYYIPITAKIPEGFARGQLRKPHVKEIWITNKLDNKKILISESIPNGWFRGRTIT